MHTVGDVYRSKTLGNFWELVRIDGELLWFCNQADRHTLVPMYRHPFEQYVKEGHYTRMEPDQYCHGCSAPVDQCVCD